MSFLNNIFNFLNRSSFGQEENYLNLVLPKLTIATNNYAAYSYGINKNQAVIERCKNLRKTYIDLLVISGFKETDLNDTYFNFPIIPSINKMLLGEYISQMPFCKYLEKTDNPKELILKLDSNSKYKELNFLSSILRENIVFENLILVFDYDDNKKNNFLLLKHIIFDNKNITKKDNLWITLLQSAYTELFLIISIEHAIWHLMVANIIYLAQQSLKKTEILKIFELAENQVFGKASEVKNILFGTSDIFQQILNNNKPFTDFVKFKITTFFSNFNIDTIYSDYLINDLNPNQNWLTGIESNIIIIKNFVNEIVSKKDISNENLKFVKFIESKNNKYSHSYKNVSIEKYLQILFVVGTVFHSTTFEFTKLIFTDIFNNNSFQPIFYGIAMGTILTDISVSFGDKSLYKGIYYKQEINYLYNKLEENREIVQEEIHKNKLFKNYNFSTKCDIMRTYQPNTYTTYV